MIKQNFINTLKKELNQAKEEMTGEITTSTSYHTMALIAEYLELNINSYSDEEIEKLLQFDNPLYTIYQIFIENEDFAEIVEDTLNVIFDNNDFDDDFDEDIDYEEDENDLPNYENV